MTQARTVLGDEAAGLLDEYLSKIARCVALLDEEMLWRRSAPGCNSVGNLLLHLEGNLSQWILAGLGGEPFERHRSAEFATRGGGDGVVLLERLHAVVDRCVAVARALDDEALGEEHEVQGYLKSGLGVLLHAVEHMSYHTGQIVMLTKQMVDPGTEIEFYPHLA